MTVEELISLNQMITDVVITVRKGGTALFDQLNIGCERGVEPRYPTMVPKEERYIGNQSIETKRKAKYIPKSINAWDDGQSYWQVKVNRIPEKWRKLEVYAWDAHGASYMGDNPRRYRNGNFHGQRIDIIALPSGESLEVSKAKPKNFDNYECEGQMSFEDWNVEGSWNRNDYITTT